MGIDNKCTWNLWQKDPIFYNPVQVGLIGDLDNVKPAYRNIFCALCNGENPNKLFPWFLVNYQNSTQSSAPCHKKKIRRYFENKEKVCKEIRGIFAKHNNLDGFVSMVHSVYGKHRMGKLCTMDRKGRTTMLHLDQKTFQMPIYIQYTPSGYIRHYEPDCTCNQCDKSIFNFITSNMTEVAESVFYFSDNKDPSKLVRLFDEYSFTKACSESARGTCMKIQKTDWRDAFSFSGSFISFVTFFAIIIYSAFYEPQKMSTRGKRDQFGVILAKLIFHLALFVSSLIPKKSIACSGFGAFLHYTMLVRCGTSIWFGWSVAKIFWKLSRNGTGQLQGDQRGPVTVVEIIAGIVVWLGSGLLVIFLWKYDHSKGGQYIGYGYKGLCYVTKKWGLLYTIVVPNIIACISNLLCSCYSIHQFMKVISNVHRNTSKILCMLSNFLKKLMAFQMLQWIFGLLYYFVPNEIVGFVFEFLVAYEGIFMLISIYHKSCIQFCKKCCSRVEKSSELGRQHLEPEISTQKSGSTSETYDHEIQCEENPDTKLECGTFAKIQEMVGEKIQDLKLESGILVKRCGTPGIGVENNTDSALGSYYPDFEILRTKFKKDLDHEACSTISSHGYLNLVSEVHENQFGEIYTPGSESKTSIKISLDVSNLTLKNDNDQEQKCEPLFIGSKNSEFKHLKIPKDDKQAIVKARRRSWAQKRKLYELGNQKVSGKELPNLGQKISTSGLNTSETECGKNQNPKQRFSTSLQISDWQIQEQENDIFIMPCSHFDSKVPEKRLTRNDALDQRSDSDSENSDWRNHNTLNPIPGSTFSNQTSENFKSEGQEKSSRNEGMEFSDSELSETRSEGFQNEEQESDSDSEFPEWTFKNDADQELEKESPDSEDSVTISKNGQKEERGSDSEISEWTLRNDTEQEQERGSPDSEVQETRSKNGQVEEQRPDSEVSEWTIKDGPHQELEKEVFDSKDAGTKSNNEQKHKGCGYIAEFPEGLIKDGPHPEKISEVENSTDTEPQKYQGSDSFSEFPVRRKKRKSKPRTKKRILQWH